MRFKNGDEVIIMDLELSSGKKLDVNYQDTNAKIIKSEAGKTRANYVIETYDGKRHSVPSGSIVGITEYYYGFHREDKQIAKAQGCECGSEAVYGANGPHTHYCPKYMQGGF